MTDEKTTKVTRTHGFMACLRAGVPSLHAVTAVLKVTVIAILITLIGYAVLGVATQHADNDGALTAMYQLKDTGKVRTWLAKKTYEVSDPIIGTAGILKYAKCIESDATAFSFYGKWVVVSAPPNRAINAHVAKFLHTAENLYLAPSKEFTEAMDEIHERETADK